MRLNEQEADEGLRGRRRRRIEGIEKELEVSKENAIRGSRPQAVPRASRRFPEGRVCAAPGCDTRLSTYNKRDKCWAHAEMKVPRLRGRKPAAGSA